MYSIFVYGNQHDNEIHAWVNSGLSSTYHSKGNWTMFGNCINEICWMIKSWKAEQIVFAEESEYEDSIWDAVTSKCDKELNISINSNGKITHLN